MSPGDPTLVPISTAIEVATAIVSPLLLAVGALWMKLAAVEQRWQDEVRRNVELVSMPSDGTPRRPPPPAWNEPARLREQRDAITDQALRDYVESRYPPAPDD
jgi:hypothetical protein